MRMIITIKSDATTHPPFNDKNLKCYSPYLQVFVALLVMPEGVRVEERFVAEGAHQPHSQVYLAHMSANGSTRG